MGKHTPGKWFLNTNLTQILNEDGHTIANISPMGAKTAEERDANARILHAAPEMYEALKQMAYCASHQCGFGCNVEKCPKPLKIQALLARIEGGE